MTSLDRSIPDQALTNYQINSSWTEYGITNTPTLGGAIASISSSVLSNNAWVNFNLATNNVQGWLNNPAANYGMWIRCASNDPGFLATYPYRLRAYFASKEYPTNSYRPKLTVTYTPPASPNVRPLVGIVSPDVNSVYALYETVPIVVSSSDPDGVVTNVKVYAGSTLIGESANPVFTNMWSRYSAGITSLTAVAWDNSGACSTSAAVRVRTRSTIYSAKMDTDPGWTLSAFWSYAKPSGAGPGSPGGGYPDPTMGFTGTNVIGYNTVCFSSVAVDLSARTPVIDCRSYTNIMLEFYAWLGAHTNTPYASVEVSNTTWKTVWSNNVYHSGAGWWYTNIDITAHAYGVSNLSVRWTHKAVSWEGSYCGWNVDDVKVTGVRMGMLSDTNADGIADSWVSNYFPTNPSAGAATNFYNGSEMNNFEKYIAGLDPTNSNDKFQVVITNSNGVPVVSFPARATSTNYYGALVRDYALEKATSLMSADWSAVAGYEDIPAIGQTVVCTGGSTNLLYYRAKAWLK